MTTNIRSRMQLLLALIPLLCAQNIAAQAANPNQGNPAPVPPAAARAPQSPQSQGEANAANTGFLTVPLSHPSQPAKVELHMLTGNITVHGGAPNSQVLIEATGESLTGLRPIEPPPEARGMRHLEPSGGWSADEENNTVTIHTGLTPVNLTVRVPTKSSLMLRTLNGAIEVQQVNGELDLESMRGGITLDQVGGSVVAHALDGNVTADMVQVDTATPSSFSSLNGRIELTLPPMLHANLNMRSDQGDIYIDQGFDFKTLTNPAAGVSQTGTGNGRGPFIRIRMDDTIRGTLNGGGVEINIRTFNGSILVHKGTATAVPVFP